MTPDQALTELKRRDHEASLLGNATAILSWDQETDMPERAVEARGEQLALLESLAHERTADPEIGNLLEAAGSTADAPEGPESLAFFDRAFLREKRRDWEQATRLPDRLVREMAETSSRSLSAWKKARAADSFADFEPWLQKTIELNREKADALGWTTARYDALLDQFEPYMTAADVTGVFTELRDGLVPLVQEIAEAPQVDNSFFSKGFPAAEQESFSRDLMKGLNYPLERGLLDRSAHPFTSTLGPHDVRITTRYSEQLPQSALFGTIHETGHALYELGIAEEILGTCLQSGTSLGIHESQSRMWENMIGRSRPFWTHWMPRLVELFPDQLWGVGEDEFYRGINKVEPSLIRVEADEVTYSLHVILRFELEQALISGDLSVSDAPAAWHEKSKALLGVRAPSDADGILQDIHWSMGAFGYFPTYALGNLYAAQFLRVIERDLPTMWQDVQHGETEPILNWLRTHIHQYGRAKSAAVLVEDITGGPLDPKPFLAYLREKYEEIYRL